MSSFRSWNKTSTASVAPASTAETTDGAAQAPSNPFGNMRRDRDRHHSGGMSYSDWKQTEKKKKDEDKPLTDADFPPLGGGVNVVVPMKKVVPGDGVNMSTTSDGVTLADRIRTAIKRQEDDALRRRIEIEEEEKKSKDALLAIPMMRNVSLREVRRNLDTEAEAYAEEENYAWQVSGEVETPEQ
jgi:hypothetical protein